MVLEKFGQIALPEGAVRDGEVIDGGAVSIAIRDLWSRTGFSHKKVTLGVANQRVVVRQIELPVMSAKDLAKALPLQVQDYVPMPVDQAVLDFHKVEDVPGEAGQMRGLLVAASRETVMASVRAAQDAGLKVTGVDLVGFAILRSMGTLNDPSIETEAIVDVGARVTNVIVHSGGVPLFVRILVMGGQDITDVVSERAGMPALEAEGIKQQIGLQQVAPEWSGVARAIDTTAQSLVDEVRGSLDYFASSNPGYLVNRIVLTGGGSKLIGLAERLSIATRLSVIPGNPTNAMQVGNTGLSDEQLLTVQPLAAVPVGLALGAV